MLPPVSKIVFDEIWESANRSDLKLFKKSALLGLILSDMIQALGLREVTEFDAATGDWFVHSGATEYSPSIDGRKRAVIELPSKLISAIVRPDCEITATASVNMNETDDTSLVVGRMISDSRFDLIAAGYREPSAVIRANSREIALGGESIGTTNLARLAVGDPWSAGLLQLDVQGPSDDELLRSTISDTIERFRQAVEDHGAWRLLYDGVGNVMRESQHQGMFKLFSRLTFGSLGIGIDTNTDHGSGNTDFTARYKRSTAIIEFKKDDRIERLRHGFAIQLPTYMKAAQSEIGYYIAMCHKRDPHDVQNILAELAANTPLSSSAISFVTIDCRRRRSASKIHHTSDII